MLLPIIEKSRFIILTGYRYNRNDEDNRAANRIIASELGFTQLLRCTGHYTDLATGKKSIEPSFLLTDPLGYAEEKALSLARLFSQESVLTERGLVCPNTEKLLTKRKAIVTIDNWDEDYTRIDLTGERFTMTFKTE